jgi:hypothetical protein
MNHRLGVSLLLVAAATISFIPQSYADELVTNGGFEQTVSAPNVTGLIRRPGRSCLPKLIHSILAAATGLLRIREAAQ